MEKNVRCVDTYMENEGSKKMDEHKDPKPDILAFVEKHMNEVVLDDMEVAKLVGFAEDEDDYYYKFVKLGSGLIWSSAVGQPIPLKGTLSEEDYERVYRLFHLNAPMHLTYQLENLKMRDKDFIHEIVKQIEVIDQETK